MLKKIVFFIIAIFAITNIFAQKEYSFEINGRVTDYAYLTEKQKSSVAFTTILLQ